MAFINPLLDVSRQQKNAEPCILVIFGATGDLTARKLIPALYNLAREGQLPTHFACVGFARRDKSHIDFREEMEEAVTEFSRKKPIDQNVWSSFKEQLYYHRSTFDDDKGYEDLKTFLATLDEKFGTKGNRVFYLSTQPSFFSLIIEKLSKHQLLSDTDPWTRVIIEKPFGHDLESAKILQEEITHHLKENQIYRIDHYLGKETVQNILIFRFSNPIFEAIWNNHHIDHVQITVAEEIGIGTRGHFFEEAGILRDIVQNHLMQLVSLVAMEPPTSFEANAIRDEKVKVMQSLRPIPKDQIDTFALRGQYTKGYINGEEVAAYTQETDVSPDSQIETFMAMELFIDNWRWAGVPFYIRAGKRLPKRATEISITFKEAPGFLFQSHQSHIDQNILVIRIQPDEGIALKMNSKVPGVGGPIQPVKMDFRYQNYFGSSPPEAYERLICDCMSGDSTLFARSDEVLASWALLTPVLNHWKESNLPCPLYPSGTWGSKESEALLERSKRKWRAL